MSDGREERAEMEKRREQDAREADWGRKDGSGQDRVDEWEQERKDS